MRVVVAGKGPAFRLISSDPRVVPVPNGEPLEPGDVLLSVQYDRILKADQIANYAHCLNLHFGPLPEYRGCYPTKWAIINGDRPGVTLHHLTPRVDAGPVLEVRTFSGWMMTDKQVYDACNQVAYAVWADWRDTIFSGRIPEGTPQDESKARYYPRELPYGGRIPDTADGELIRRLRLAYTHPPYPGLQE